MSHFTTFEFILNAFANQTPGIVLGVISALTFFLGRGFIKEYFYERARKIKEKLELGDMVIASCSVINISESSKDIAIEKYRTLGAQVKGYDQTLGSLIVKFQISSNEMTDLLKEIHCLNSSKSSFQEIYELTTAKSLEVSDLRDEIILRAHRLRGTLGVWSIQKYRLGLVTRKFGVKKLLNRKTKK